MHTMRYFGYWPHGLYGGGFMLILGLVLAAILVYWIVKKSSSSAVRSSNALNLLDEKFALGEISEEEYLNKKKLLKK